MKAKEIAEELLRDIEGGSLVTGQYVLKLAKSYLDLLAKYQALEKAARDILLPPSDPHMDIYGIREEMNRREINLKRILHQQQLTPDGARNEL